MKDHTEWARWKNFRLPGDANGHHPHLSRRDQGGRVGPLYEAPSIQSRVLSETYMPWSSSPSLLAIASLPLLPVNGKSTTIVSVLAVGLSFLPRRHRQRIVPVPPEFALCDQESDLTHLSRQFMHFSAEITSWIRNPMDLYDLWDVQAGPFTPRDEARRDWNKKRRKISGKGVDRRTDLPYRCAPVRKERTPNTQVERLDSHGGLS